jgi:t-SNARE complex subunit (syntaxin)
VKNVALAINTEVRDQNTMLDKLDKSVDKNLSDMEKTNSKLDNYLNSVSSNSSTLWIIAVILFIAMVLQLIF